MRVGNLDTRRDFTDVRDMVRAYWLILERGDPDALYLACRGASTPVREIIERLGALARIPVTFTSDPGLRREGEQPDLYGSPERLRADTGWTPGIPIETTLADTLAWWRERGEPGGGLTDHMPRALITGITGQDGSYLAELLLGQGLRGVGRGAPRRRPSRTSASTTCASAWGSSRPTCSTSPR